MTKSGTLRFTHIGMENWRNFTSVGVNLERRVFLVGANALGKSNFLDAFRFLHDIVSVGGGFQEAVRRRGGVSNLRCLAARKGSDILIRTRIGTGEAASTWEYELSFGQDNLRRPIIKKESVMRNGSGILSRPDRQDKADPERLTQTYLEQVYANKVFRKVADFFSSIRYLHIVPQLIREPDRSAGRRGDPFGGDFLEQISRTPDKTRNARLERIVNALCVAVPQLKELELKRDAKGAPHLHGKYEHWRRRGAWQTEEQFSDGTLRLFGLLWAALDGRGPLLIEEPELSLHPEVVRFIPQMFARIQRRFARQMFISTHSSDLLRDEGIGLDEVLLLQPGEGTTVTPASSFDEIRALLEGGSVLADAVIPRTRPHRVEQLTLLGD
ncbi:AAA family ATPase [Candidatus Poribacteria bacterium]|nr:AAA family ATPase [Candidatus Poribacteria bacterium]